MPHWTMPLLTNETLWLYCSVEDHCQKGMSMSIVVGNNPDADQTLEKYQAAAANVAVASAPTTTIVEPSFSHLLLVLPPALLMELALPLVIPQQFTSKGSTVTATRSGSASGSASATSSGTAVTASGAAGQIKVPVALGFAGIAGGLAAFMI
ncbi:hypothetical protein DID88_004527 [Monilinia fructigena]|uniref:Phytocyanin domain-containing protein n=1 Tax=Monilinia fructigena TaxID=38457 RepID=A0A395IS52_9HELO|nr:hypothetical protein DID88_004527 [Monilinia fructigena]